MKTVKLITLLALTTAISACVFHVGGKGKTANVKLTETLQLDASRLSELVIDAGAGSLTIIGSDTTTITVEANITTDENKSYVLTLEKMGNKAKLIASQDSFGNWYGSSPYTDLTVTLPQNLALDIDDGSGDIRISRVNNSVSVDDGSGSMTISNINGALNIEDGSGSISFNDINGNINLDDGSGETTIENTIGDINIEDGSGEVTVLNTSGKVTIDDGSGDITIKGAGGLKIIEAGSGGLKVSNITGEMDIDY